MDSATFHMLHFYQSPWDVDHDVSREISGWIYQNIGFQNKLDQQLITVPLSVKCRKIRTSIDLSIAILLPSLFLPPLKVQVGDEIL